MRLAAAYVIVILATGLIITAIAALAPRCPGAPAILVGSMIAAGCR